MVVLREDAPAPRIPQFFAGRAVFITGATGFMGKVLVERLLWTCPEVGKLFLLMRSKAGAKPQDRLLTLKRCKVFDVIRERCPAQLDKLRVVCGDITKPGLSISPDSLAELEEVSVVFNCAATVRFDEALRPAAEQNVLSVVQLLELCDRLPGIQAFVQVSTGYSNAERTSVAERVYPLPSALANMLANALAAPDNTSEEEVKRIISPKPNTYTYTKMMGEAAVAEHRTRGYPKAIFRPTIVIASLRHPFPGWIENYNGPSGVIIIVVSGLLHVFRCNGYKRADLLPVDMAIDTLIAVAWETAIDNSPSVRVYNCSTSENPTTWEDLRAAMVNVGREYPLADALWYPTCLFTKSRFIYETVKLLVQTIPFHVIEYMMRIFTHQKSRINLIKMHGRLCGMNAVLEFFATREWAFGTDNVRRLRARLSHADAATFNLDPSAIDWPEHHKNFVRGCQVYLSKDKAENLPEARKRLHRIYLVHRTVTILFPLLLIYQLINPRLLYNVVQQSLHCAALIISSVSYAYNIWTQSCLAVWTWVDSSEVLPFKIL
ncbi:hypothetical protein ABMA27_011160 [Loxostege sticticalis]|uniref:Fatty acyl-CoA reductase n=1 Tax=Loxostege sticticalis TaxID=481309 RepID=A0ABR3H1H9_LOXSC